MKPPANDDRSIEGGGQPSADELLQRVAEKWQDHREAEANAVADAVLLLREQSQDGANTSDLEALVPGLAAAIPVSPQLAQLWFELQLATRDAIEGNNLAVVQTLLERLPGATAEGVEDLLQLADLVTAALEFEVPDAPPQTVGFEP